MPVGDYDPVPANNVEIAGIDISEGCDAAGFNNALRQIMADIATWTDAYAVTYPISIANGGTGAATAAAARAALSVFGTGGGTVTNDSLIDGKWTRVGYGVMPHFASTSMTGGRIFVQASGTDPTSNPGDWVFEY